MLAIASAKEDNGRCLSSESSIQNGQALDPLETYLLPLKVVQRHRVRAARRNYGLCGKDR